MLEGGEAKGEKRISSMLRQKIGTEQSAKTNEAVKCALFTRVETA